MSISKKTLLSFIKDSAERFSEIRRLEQFFWKQQEKLAQMRYAPSHKHEMENDWKNACAFVVSKILHDEGIEFNEINSNFYPIMEKTWLKDIKEQRAYCVWKSSNARNADSNYFKACENIRYVFRNKKTVSLDDFEKVKTYIENYYLQNGKLRKSDTVNALIGRKAERIYQATNNENEEDNWFCARLYTRLFYENIIPAILDSSEHHILKVLRAFEFSKCKKNRFFIINAFETCIPINFFNKDKLNDILEKPWLYDYNIVVVKSWPDEIDIKSICCEKLKYKKQKKHLIYEGIMHISEKKQLLSQLKDDNQKNAVEMLFEQSRLEPYSNCIL